jgi:hypothetical protein
VRSASRIPASFSLAVVTVNNNPAAIMAAAMMMKYRSVLRGMGMCVRSLGGCGLFWPEILRNVLITCMAEGPVVPDTAGTRGYCCRFRD